MTRSAGFTPCEATRTRLPVASMLAYDVTMVWVFPVQTDDLERRDRPELLQAADDFNLFKVATDETREEQIAMIRIDQGIVPVWSAYMVSCAPSDYRARQIASVDTVGRTQDQQSPGCALDVNRVSVTSAKILPFLRRSNHPATNQVFECRRTSRTQYRSLTVRKFPLRLWNRLGRQQHAR